MSRAITHRVRRRRTRCRPGRRTRLAFEASLDIADDRGDRAPAEVVGNADARTHTGPGPRRSLRRKLVTAAPSRGCRTNHSEMRCVNWSAGSHMSGQRDWASEWDSDLRVTDFLATS